ncbi:MAG: TIGR00341 family protein [Promethearchaeota archaeon]
MKQVKVILPVDKLPIVRELEERLELSFDILIHQENITILLVIENNQTSALIEEFRGVGIGRIFGTITLNTIDLEISSESKAKKLRKISGRGISLDEMISNISSLGVISPTFVFLTILAGLLAAFGLLFSNVVIIIASMIIAPFLGPIALTVLGTMLPKNPHRLKALLTEIFGLSGCVLIGIAIGSFIRLPVDLSEIPEVFNRTEPGGTDIIFAVISGLAAGIFIVRGESTNIVGVAVAASLCPPATNIGILLVNARFPEALGSLLLLLLNVISIYSTCAIIFWSSQSFSRGGTISSRQYKKISKRYYVQIVVVIAILISIIVFILIYSSV